MKGVHSAVTAVSAMVLLTVLSPAALAAKGTLGVTGCNVTYDTGTASYDPSTGHVSYSGPSFSADTSGCVPETPPERG